MHAMPHHLQPYYVIPMISQVAPNSSVTVSIGDVLIINGVKYTLTSVPTLVPSSATPPPPPPPPPPMSNVSGYKSPDTGLAVTQAAPGALLKIEGSGFPSLAGGALGRVQINSQELVVLTWAPTEIEVRIPAGMPLGPAAVKLYWQASLSASPQAITTGAPSLTIQAASPPPPAPIADCPIPFISDYETAAGIHLPPPDFLLKASTNGIVIGSCFGVIPGKILFAGAPLTVISWSDAMIQFIAPSLPSGLGVVTVVRADGVSQGFRGFGVSP